MTATLWRRVLPFSFVAALAACGGGGDGDNAGDCDAGSQCADASDCETGDCACVDDPTAPGCPCEDPTAPGCQAGPEPICTAGTVWTEGTAIFREVTADWGLVDLGVQGTRINVVDYDGDGLADILVRRGGTRADEFDEDGPRHTWLLRNDGNGGFTDETWETGILDTRQSYTTDYGRPGDVYAFADVDNDGDLDVYSGINRGADEALSETSELMINHGGFFAFSHSENEVRRLEDPEHVAGAAFADVNRDGLIDLWVTRNSLSDGPQADSLYMGVGEARFEENVVPTAPWSDVADLNGGLAHSNAWSATACDLNDDGIPDLLAASYGRAPNLLFRGVDQDGDYQLDNRSVASGYAFDHRTDWSDNESARCFCQLNPDAEDCAGVPAPAFTRCSGPGDILRWNHESDREPYRLGGNSGTTVCADVDNDGALDLLTTEIVHWDVGTSSDPSELLFNTGDPEIVFERPGNDVTGLTREHEIVDWNDGDITATVFDFDNDGWPDIYIGSTDYPGARGLLYHQESPRHFVPVPIADGFEHNRSHGVGVADFDRDGDLDLVVGHSRARCDANGPNNCYETAQVRLFENVLGQDGNWVQLRLEGGEGTNRSAIGARVTVTAGGVTQTQEVGGGYGHYGAQNDLVLHFGLGAACEAEVEVRWPNRALETQTFTVPAGYRFDVLEGAAPVVDGAE